MGGKLSLPTKIAAAIFTGHEPGTEFQIIDPFIPAEERVAQMGIAASEAVLPFAAHDYAQEAARYLFPEFVPEPSSSQSVIPHTGIPVGMPSVRGITPSRAIKAYYDAKKDHRDDIAEAVLDAAEQNNIRRSAVRDGYKSRLRHQRQIIAGPKRQWDVYGKEIEPPPPVRQ